MNRLAVDVILRTEQVAILTLGIGLWLVNGTKLPTDFRDTHLGQIGRG